MAAGNKRGGRGGRGRSRSAEATGTDHTARDSRDGRSEAGKAHTTGKPDIRSSERPGDYAGSRLGLPEDGPGALGGWGPRLVALFVDWLIANLIVLVVIRSPEVWQAPFTGVDLLPLIVFGLEIWLLTAFLGASAGHRVAGLAAIDLNGSPPGLARSAARTALILLVVPPLVVDPDGRGLHDRAAGTLLVRAR